MSLSLSAKSFTYIVLFALLVRLVVFFACRPWDIDRTDIISGDSMAYHVFALTIATTGKLECPGQTFYGFPADAIRTPGYPLIIAPLYYLFGAKPWIVVIFQILMNLCVFFIIYFTANMFFSQRAAHVAAILYAVEPHTVINCFSIMTDIPFTLFFATAVFLLLWGVKSNKIWPVLASALVLGLCTLIRPITLYFPVVFSAFVLVLYPAKIMKRAQIVIAALILFMAPISPWMYRNYRKYGAPSLSCLQGYNLLMYNAASVLFNKHNNYADVKDRLVSMAESNPRYDKNNPFAASKAYQATAMKIIYEHPLKTVVTHLRSVLNPFLTANSGYFCAKLGIEPNGKITFPYHLQYAGYFTFLSWYIHNAGMARIFTGAVVITLMMLLNISALAGLYFMIRDKEYLFAMITIVATSYFVIVTMPVGWTRYLLPVMPFLAVSGGVGIDRAVSIFTKTPKIRRLGELVCQTR